MILSCFTDALVLPEDINKEVFLITNGVLIGSLLLSAAIFYGIFCIIKRQNSTRLFLWALQGSSKDKDLALQLLDTYDNIDLNARNINGVTALNIICRGGFTNVLSKLVEEPKGLNFNGTDTNGYSAFHIACRKNNLKVVELLVENSRKHNINLNAKSDQQSGSTGFRMACNVGNIEVIEYIKANAEKYGIDLEL